MTSTGIELKRRELNLMLVYEDFLKIGGKALNLEFLCQVHGEKILGLEDLKIHGNLFDHLFSRDEEVEKEFDFYKVQYPLSWLGAVEYLGAALFENRSQTIVES